MARKIAVTVVALGVFLAQAACAHAAIYWGATISGEVYGQSDSAPLNQSAWDSFERHAGKEVTVVNAGQDFGEFDTAKFQAVRNRGAIPLVTTGLPPAVTLGEIAAGSQDSVIRAWARQAKAWGYPFLFAPWWEMNGGWFPWGRNPSFVAAWRRFHDLVVEEGATNVSWTWVANGIWFDPASDPAPYYPGDAYVDWTGVDVYNWGDNPLHPNRWLNPDQTLTATLDRIKEIAPGKPICVCEEASTEIGGDKANWIRSLLTTYLPHHPEVKAYVWFNWNILQYGDRFDWQIESSAPAQQAFRMGIQGGYYLSALPALTPLTKVPIPATPSGGSGIQGMDLSAIGQDGAEPQIAAAPDGTATIVWSRFDGSDSIVQERRIAAGGGPDVDLHDLSAPGEDAFLPQIGVAPDGTATAVWSRFDGPKSVIQERRVAADGMPDPSTHDLTGSGRNAGEPQVAVAPDGTATVVWSRYDGSAFIVQERRIAADGTPDAGTHNLSAGGENAVDPQVAVAPDGTATVVWSRYDGADSVIQERRVAAAGSPGATTFDLSAGGENAVEPQVAVAPDGTATAVWSRYDGSAFVVQERRIAPGGVPAVSTHALSASGRDAVEPQVEVDGVGTATAIWSRFDGSSWIVQERRIAADGTPAAGTRDLSAAGRGAGGPQLAGESDSAVTATWRGFNGSNDIVQGSTLIAPAPSLQPASHDFGLLTIGARSSATQHFVVSNAGSAPLVIQSVALESDQAGFVLDGPASCTGAPIAPGASCRVSVAFVPVATGVQRTQLTVSSTASFTPYVASLSGTGVRATVPVARPPRTAAPIPSNAFTIGRPRLSRRTGTAMLPVTVPGPGGLSIGGKGIVHSSRLVPAAAKASAKVVDPAGTVYLPVRSKGAKKRKLERDGSVRVRVEVVFAPTGGIANSQALAFKLQRRQVGSRAANQRRWR